MFMSSYFDASGNLSKFVLQRLIGRFLQEDLDLDQLKVRLFRGELELFKLNLNPDAIHETLGIDPEQDYLPFKIAAGSVRYLKLTVHSFDRISVDIEGLSFIIRPVIEKHIENARLSRQRSSASIAKKSRSLGRGDSGSSTHGSKEQSSGGAAEEAQGLSDLDAKFEQILSNLRITAKNITLRFLDHQGQSAVVLRLDSIYYRNFSNDNQEDAIGEADLQNQEKQPNCSSIEPENGESAHVPMQPPLPPALGASDSPKKALTLRGMLLYVEEGEAEAGKDEAAEEKDGPAGWMARCHRTVDTIATLTFNSRVDKSLALPSFSAAIIPPVLDADFFFHHLHLRLTPQIFRTLTGVVSSYEAGLRAAKEAATVDSEKLSLDDPAIGRQGSLERGSHGNVGESLATGEDSCSMSSSAFFDAEDGGSVYSDPSDAMPRDAIPRRTSTASITSAALLLSPTQSPKKKVRERSRSAPATEQILLAMAVQVMKVQIEIIYDEERESEDSAALTTWLHDDDKKAAVGFEDLDGFGQMEGQQEKLVQDRVVIRMDDVNINASFSASNAACTMAAADIGAAELLQKGLDRQAPADAMWLNLLARYVEKPPAPGVQGDHGGFHERNCLHFSYESNASARSMNSSQELMESSNTISIEVHALRDLQVFWDNGLAIRLGSYFKATPSTSDNGPADDVPPVAMIFHAPKVMLCARPVDLKATEQHFIRDEQLVFTLHEVEVTPLREGGIGPCASGAKIIFQQGKMEMKREGKVEEIATVSRGSAGNEDILPEILWKERKPYSAATAESMFQAALRKAVVDRPDYANRVHQSAEEENEEVPVYKKVERVNAKGFATALSVIELTLPKAFIKINTELYALVVQMGDELAAVAGTSAHDHENQLEVPPVEASLFAIGVRCAQGYVRAVDDETQEVLLAEVASLELTMVDDAMTISAGDLSLYDAEEAPILHSSKWAFATNNSPPPVFQMFYAQEKEGGAGFEETDTEEFVLSLALCNIVWRASKQMLWVDILFRFLMAELPNPLRVPSAPKTSFTALSIQLQDAFLAYSNEDSAAIASVSTLRASSNVVYPSEVQAHQISILDMRGFLRDMPLEHDALDHRCWPAQLRGSAHQSCSSLLEFAEERLFAQVLSLDSCALFLRQREDFASPVAVDIEIASSLLKMYTCCDSFLTLCTLLEDLLQPQSDSASLKQGAQMDAEKPLLGEVSADAFAPPSAPFKLRCDVLIAASATHDAAAQQLKALLEKRKLSVQVNASESAFHACIILFSDDLMAHEADLLRRLATGPNVAAITDVPCSLQCPHIAWPEAWTDQTLRAIAQEWLGVDHPDDGPALKSVDSTVQDAEVVEAVLGRESLFVVLAGMGGSGKTMAARQAFTTSAVSSHFFNGMAWISIGCEAPSLPLLDFRLRSHLGEYRSNVCIVLDDVWTAHTVASLPILRELDSATSCVMITSRDETLLSSSALNARVLTMETQASPAVRDDQRSAAELRAMYADASDDQLSASQLRSRYAKADVQQAEDESTGLSAKWLLAETMEEVAECGIVSVDGDEEFGEVDDGDQDQDGLGFVRLERQGEAATDDGFDVREELAKSLKESENLARWEIEESNDIAVEEMHLAKRMYEQMVRSVAAETPLPSLSHGDSASSTFLAPSSSSSASSSRAFWYKNVNVKIIPHHMGIPYTAGVGSHIPPSAVLEAKLQGGGSSSEAPSRRVAMRVIVRDLGIQWRLFGGFDWNASVDAKATSTSTRGDSAERKEERKEELLRALLAEEMAPKSGQLRPLRRAKRDLGAMIEVELRGVSAMMDSFAEGEEGKSGEYVRSSVAVAVRDVEISDHLESSPINKLLSFWVSETKHPRVTGSSMLRVSVDVMDSLATECKIRLAILPLRLHLDQDAVDFAINFFTFESIESQQEEVTSQAPTQAIVLTTRGPDAQQEDAAHQEQIYFQSVDIRAFKIKIDYWPKRINFAGLKQGSSFEMINLFAYEALEVDLHRFQAQGVMGRDGLLVQVLEAWKEDVIKKQLHKCLAGVAIPPLNTLASLGASIGGLILIPMDQYRKDGRVIEGVRKGTRKLVKTFAVEALSTANKLTGTTQTLLEHADDIIMSSASKPVHNMLTEGGEVAKSGGTALSKRADQPRNVQEGLEQAADSLATGVKRAVQMVVAVPLREYEHGGTTSAVKSVIRAAPIAVIRPIIGATEAMSFTLLGMRNSVDPEVREDMQIKYKRK